MKTVNFNDFKEKRNWYNETTKFHFNNDVIVTDRMFGHPFSDIIVYTNENSFIYSDSDNEVIKIHKLKENEILFSHFLFNTKTNTLTDLLSLEHKNPKHTDPFVKVFKNEIKHKEVKVVSLKNGKKTILANGYPVIEIIDNKLNRIHLKKTKSIPANFLYLDSDLKDANLPNVSKISDYSFHNNIYMKTLYAPNTTHIGKYVLWLNAKIKMCHIPSATNIGSEFLNFNQNKELITNNIINNNLSKSR